MLHDMAYEILVPQPGIKLIPPALETESYLLDHQGSPRRRWNIYMVKKKKKQKKNTLLAYIPAYLNIQKRGETMDEKKDSGSNKILATAFKMQFIYSML